MDGGPHQRIDNGSTWQAQYTIMNEEATFWYHPHLENKTAEHVYHGLAGLFIVKDPQSELDLPAVSYTHLRAHETDSYPVRRLLLEKKKKRENGYAVLPHAGC